jgi:hypothetical protein
VGIWLCANDGALPQSNVAVAAMTQAAVRILEAIVKTNVCTNPLLLHGEMRIFSRASGGHQQKSPKRGALGPMTALFLAKSAVLRGEGG